MRASNSPMMQPTMKRVFLNDPEPLLGQAVRRLTLGRDRGEGTLDLSDSVVILPTRTARRKLHEALVLAAGDIALIPPAWFLPMQFLEDGGHRIAPVAVEQLCWINVIKSCPIHSLRGLFPGRRVPSLDNVGCSQLGSAISGLRADLAASGLSLKGIVGDAAGIDEARREILCSLEEEFVAAIGREGFRDRISVQLEGMERTVLPKGIRRVVVAGVPDLPKACERALAVLAARSASAIAVEILIHDPENKGGEWFDPAGRPAGSWSREVIGIPVDRIHPCADEDAMAGVAAVLCRASGAIHETTALGSTSPELAALLHGALCAAGLDTFNPAGRPLDTTAPGNLLKLLLLHLEEQDFRSALRMMRHADVTRWLPFPEKSFGADQFERLDELQKRLIPSSLGELLARWPEDPGSDRTDGPIKAAVAAFLDLVTPLLDGRGCAPVLEFLRAIYGARRIDLMPGSAEAAVTIREWISAAGELSSAMPARDIIRLIHGMLAAGILTGEKTPGAMEIQGWLELLWEDAPHLVIAGMSDGRVPEVRPADPFLPEKAREFLGMPCNRNRFVRDCYLIRAIMSSRPEGIGRADFLISRHDEEGVFQKPSRLLLSCPDKELPDRVERLFRDAESRPASPWRASWRLKAERLRKPDHVSSSSIKDYLSCPARYCFKNLAGLKREKFGIEEIEATGFGDLLHIVLQEFGTDTAWRDLSEAGEIAETLVEIWTRTFEGRFGKATPLALVYQREIGIRRLRKVAEVQAEERAKGWKIVACELEFEGFRPLGSDADTMPLPITGRIDRVDFRETAEGIEWRILDYKSGEQAQPPEKTHFKAISKLDDVSLYAAHELVTLAKKVKAGVKHCKARWIDLQLPIYALLGEAIREGSHVMKNLPIKGGAISSGYFLLPANLDDTGVSVFEPFEGWRESAAECIAGVSRAISEGLFWPPRRPKHDDFKDLFFDRMESTDERQATVVPPSGNQTSAGEGVA